LGIPGLSFRYLSITRKRDGPVAVKPCGFSVCAVLFRAEKRPAEETVWHDSLWIVSPPKVLQLCPAPVAMLHQVSNEVTNEVESLAGSIDCWNVIAYNLYLRLCL
jgi:hypothetical protein